MSLTFIGNHRSATIQSGSAGKLNYAIAGNYDTITAGDYVGILAGSYDTITLGNNGFVVAGWYDTITAGDNNTIVVADRNVIQAGNNDTVYAGNYNTISLSSGHVSAGNNDTINLPVGGILFLDKLGSNGTINASKATLNFDDHITATINGTGDTLNVAPGDMITIGGVGGATPSKSSFSMGTGSGATLNGGLGIDTFTSGASYDGGNRYVVSYHDGADGFAGIGNCINYAPLTYRVSVDLNAQVGYGIDAGGGTLWTDTYVNMQQAKAAIADGNDLSGSDAFFSELKGSQGSVTYHAGSAGARIFWGSDGLVNNGLTPATATSLGPNAGDVAGANIAYGGAGTDEFYWWNQPGKLSNLYGQTIYNFDPTHDDLNFSELAQTTGSSQWRANHTSGSNVTPHFYAVTTSFDADPNNPAVLHDDNPLDWVAVSLSADGMDTLVQFAQNGSGAGGTNSGAFQTAAVLKGTDLFAQDSAAYHGGAAVSGSQVVLDLYAHNNLVFNHTI